MDFATILGLLCGIGVMVYAVVSGGGSLRAFIDLPAIACVFGGVGAAVLICFPLRTVLSIGRVTGKVLFNKQDSVPIPKLIEIIVSLSETARRDGLLALEGRLREIPHPFVVLGIQMAVDGTRPEIIEDIMRTEIDAVATRHRDGKAMCDQIGRFAPAFGMIGTLLGLVMMLGNMTDPSSIGAGMAVALLTTLYGAVLSNLFFLPFSEKLNFLNKQELLTMEIAVRGVLGIQSGDNPRVIGQRLNTFLPPRLRIRVRRAA